MSSRAVRGVCVAVTWFASGRVADVEGDGFKMLEVALSPSRSRKQVESD